jgi:hypothetical protein
MAELYRLGCLVDPTLAAVTDDDDNGRAQASPAAAAQPPQPQPQRTVFLVLPPDDTLSPDDVPTAARADGRSALESTPERRPQTADPGRQRQAADCCPAGRSRPRATLCASGRGLRARGGRRDGRPAADLHTRATATHAVTSTGANDESATADDNDAARARVGRPQ